MKYPFFALIATLSLSFSLGLAGCKSNNSQPASSQTQPASSAPAGQPAANPPTAANSPAASNPPASPAAGQPAAPEGSQAAAPAPPPPPPPPAVVNLATGTEVRVRLDSDLSSESSHEGDKFSATVADNVLAHGTVVIPRGARAEGTVLDAKPLGRFKGGALLSVRLDRVHTRWGGYPVSTSTIERAEKGKGARSAGFIGGGAAFGALIGGLAGGGKGAAIGALAGGGAGTAGSAFTDNKQIVLPAETLLTFRLDHSVRITEEAQPQPQLQPR
jgi:hypothetical protein